MCTHPKLTASAGDFGQLYYVNRESVERIEQSASGKRLYQLRSLPRTFDERNVVNFD